LFDERIIRVLLSSKNTVLFTPADQSKSAKSGGSVAAHVDAELLPRVLELLRNGNSRRTVAQDPDLHFVEPSNLVRAYNASLRRASTPYLVPVRPDDVEMLEARIFDASYKGVTDVVTKWIWPPPARWVTRCLARAGVHPNIVTLFSWVLATVVTVLFARSWFGVGLVVGWLMTFLDTVDGKLARVTLRSSRLGNFLDHGLDLLHPPVWYVAWAAGLPASALLLGPALVVTVLGYLAGRVIEGAFLLLFRVEIHCWRPTDSHFRTVTARRNPNLILLTIGVLGGRPDLGLVLVAAWTAICVAFHAVRLLQALADRWRGHPVQTWLDGRTACDPTDCL
jgi:phosphatidylglycerophosphate synthase